MDSSQLFGITTLLYLFASVFYLALFIFKNNKPGVVGFWLAVAGLLTHTAALGLRWYESYQLGMGRAPLTNMYESLVFFAWSITLFYLIIEIKFKHKVIGTFIMPMALASMAYASFGGANQEITPLIPALQSNWLIAHVVTSFLGYAGFAVAFGLGLMYLIKQLSMDDVDKKENDQLIPDLAILDDLIHKSMVFGFVLLTAAIISGSVWASVAWGSYWTWDPKEVWSLITWFVYALILHLRFTRGWNGTIIAVLSIVGFASVLFTFFVVNYLLSGLHSYGAS